MPDVYYSPEKFDLKPYVEVELDEPNYSFDILMVWKHESGKFYWATDSGCSCPSPFEEYTYLESLEELTSANLPVALEILKSVSYEKENASKAMRKLRRAIK